MFRPLSLSATKLRRPLSSLLCRSLSTPPTPAYFITTPIFYVNAAPHLGHLYTALLADAQSRYRSLAGHEAFLSTGTDEHGVKVERAAAVAGLDNGTFCDRVSAEYSSLFDLCSVGYDDFVRTTEARHAETVTRLWQRLDAAGYLRKNSYKGWYCVADETFLTESQIDVKEIDGGKKLRVSTESGHPVEWQEEENYVFRIGDFRERLIDWLNKSKVVFPKLFNSSLSSALSEMNFQEVLSVSRPRSRQSWGIPVPGDPSQVVYVWLDALANYLTVSEEVNNVRRNKRVSWPGDVHVIGKDILKFHAIYWPAFLMAADLELPKNIFVHSHWLVDGRKMSKSSGNVVDPRLLVDRFSGDGLRYILLREGVPHSDGNYSEQKMINYLNSELANTLGNLLGRCTSKTVNTSSSCPAYSDEAMQKYCSHEGLEIMSSLEELSSEVASHYERFEYYKGVDLIMEVLRNTNSYIQNEKPWELRKNASEKIRLDVVLYVALESLRISGLLLQPIVPKLSGNLLDKLSVKSRMWNDAVPSKSSLERPLSDTKAVFFKRITA